MALLAAGADPNARNNNGETPLHRADSANDVTPLLAAGANLNARDNVGETPLHEATAERSRSADVAAALLAAGADPNARDATGATPLDVMRSAFEELGGRPRPPLYWLLNDVTAR